MLKSIVRVLFLMMIVSAMLFLLRTVKIPMFQKKRNKSKKQGVADPCKPFRPSPLATQLLDGLHGVEIGASTQNSFNLSRSISINYADDQGTKWQNPCFAPNVVNLVADGGNLPFKDSTLDYVLSSHVFEHFFDPIGTLREWYRVIKVGGFIYMTVPHIDRTFDHMRNATELSELMQRANGTLTPQDYAYPTNLTHVGLLNPNNWPHALVDRKRNNSLYHGYVYFREDDHHHWSAWRTHDFVEMVNALHYKILKVQDIDDKVGNGFTVVIQKEGPTITTITAPITTNYSNYHHVTNHKKTNSTTFIRRKKQVRMEKGHEQ